nr:hypothetical protein [Methanocorpusculum sp.]
MDYSYYKEIGLLTESMIQIIADYQRNAPTKYIESAEKSLQMSNAQTALSQTIGRIDFCKLDVSEYGTHDGYLCLKLNKSTYEDGVIYRSDFDKSKDNRFKWIVTESLNPDGDPLNAAAGMIYIIHNPKAQADRVTWDKAYLKAIDNEDDPSQIELWLPISNADTTSIGTDNIYLFSYNGINGHLGTLEANDESAVTALKEAVKVVTVEHPVIFTPKEPVEVSTDSITDYGWMWKYKPRLTSAGKCAESDMYFTYKADGDVGWKYVYFQTTDAHPESGSYWYDYRSATLYRRSGSAWVKLDSAAQKKVAEVFATVYMFGKARDRYYQGLYENYRYTVAANQTIAAGNYYFENDYRSYYVFTTEDPLNAGDTLTYNYDTGWIVQRKDGVEKNLKPKGYRFDNVRYHQSNILSEKGIEDGRISSTNGALNDNDASNVHCRSSSYIDTVPLTDYVITGTSKSMTVHYYDDKKDWLSCSSPTTIGNEKSFRTPANSSFIKICVQSDVSSFAEYENVVIRARNLDNSIVIDDINYFKITGEGTGNRIGLLDCVERFVEHADATYGTFYSELKAAQNAITTLEKQMTSSIGDLYREGWWQDASYVDGDEDKLCADALENLAHVCKPETTYNITYLDLYDSNSGNADYAAASETADVKWPDISIQSAVHLIDPEIAVNTWAYLDKIQKCYDKPWLTKIAINTNLSTIAQHSFTDVMTHIANVAGEMKGRISYYDKTMESAESDANIMENEQELITVMERRMIRELYEDDGSGNGISKLSRIAQTVEGISTTVEDIEGSSIIQQTAAAIQAVVRDSEAGNEFRTSSVTINRVGVAINTSGTFTVDSGNFDVDENGGVTVNGNIRSGGKPVLTNGDIYFGTTSPSNPKLNMIWIKPLEAESESGGTGDTGGAGGTGDSGDE